MKQSNEKLKQYLSVQRKQNITQNSRKSTQQSPAHSPIQRYLEQLTRHKKLPPYHSREFSSMSNKNFTFTNSFINRKKQSQKNIQSIQLYSGINKKVAYETMIKQSSQRKSKSKDVSQHQQNKTPGHKKSQSGDVKCLNQFKDQSKQHMNSTLALQLLKHAKKSITDKKVSHKKGGSLNTFEKLIQQKVQSQKQTSKVKITAQQSTIHNNKTTGNITANSSFINNQPTINMNSQNYKLMIQKDCQDKNNTLINKINTAMLQTNPFQRLNMILTVIERFGEINPEYLQTITKLRTSIKIIEETIQKNQQEQTLQFQQEIQKLQTEQNNILEQNNQIQQQLNIQIQSNNQLEQQLMQQYQLIQEQQQQQNNNIKNLTSDANLQEYIQQQEKKIEQFTEKENKMIKLLMAIKKRGIDIDKIYNIDVLNEELDASQTIQVDSDIRVEKQKSNKILDAEGIPQELPIQFEIVQQGNLADHSIVNTSDQHSNQKNDVSSIKLKINSITEQDSLSLNL